MAFCEPPLRSLPIASTSSSIPSKSVPIPSRLTPAADAAPATTIQFTTVEELFKQIDHVIGDYLAVQGVSPEDFAKIENVRGARRQKFRFRRYEAKSQILIITVPTAAHEELHTDLNSEISFGIAGMGLRDDWRQIGSTTFRPRGHPGGDGGEGDSSSAPRSQRRGGQAWPTLVIEAGHSETLDELRVDMRWWFGASDHDVKIVLLAKLEENRGEIILEKWVEVPLQPRPGATTTRAAAQVVPNCSQHINITRAPGITNFHPNRFNPMSYIVTSGALRLEFDRLFLRQPGQGGGDIIIGIPRLQMYAVHVWEAVV